MTTYYVDKSGGADGDTGLSEIEAWETINKVNISSFNAGDSILFKRGEEWNETLTMPNDGSSGNHITFGAYGTGNNPKLQGLTTETGFVVDVSDEIFGDQSTDATEYYKNYVYFTQFTTVNGGVLKSLHVYIGADAPTHMKCAIYTDTGADEPGDLIANTTSEEKTSFSTTAYNTLNVSGGATLLPSTIYWLALHTDSVTNPWDGAEDTGGGDKNGFDAETYGSGFPATAIYTAMGTSGGGIYATIEVGTPGVYKKTGFTVAATIMKQCFEDSTRMIYKASKGALVSGSYYFDDGSDILYIQTTGDDDPSGYTIERPNLKDGIDFNGKSYIDVDDIDAEGHASCFCFRETAGSTYVNVTGCTATNAGMRGFDCGGYVDMTLNYILFTSCISNDAITEAFWIGNGANVGIVSCTAYNCAKAQGVKGYPAGGIGGIVVGIRAVDCYVTDTYLYDIYSQPGLSVEFEDTYDRPLRTLINRNKFIQTRDSSVPAKMITCEGQDSVYRYNIVRAHCDQAGFWATNGSVDESWYNNAVHTSKYAAPFVGDDGSNITLKNNVFYSERNDAVIEIKAAASSGFDSDYNCFYHEGVTNGGFDWEGTDYDTLALWKAQSGTDANSIQSGPLFTDKDNENYILQSISPCINAGVDVGLTQDYAGTTVPQGSAPDMGAYEYPAAGDGGAHRMDRRIDIPVWKEWQLRVFS